VEAGLVYPPWDLPLPLPLLPRPLPRPLPLPVLEFRLAILAGSTVCGRLLVDRWLYPLWESNRYLLLFSSSSIGSVVVQSGGSEQCLR
jgi:hypothetical protein